MKLIFASDSFKGTLESARIAELLEKAARAVFGDDTAAMYYSFLTKSFRCEYTGEINVIDLNAFVPVRVWYADMTDASARIDEGFDVQLDRVVQANSRKDVYGDDDSYEGWVIEQAYTDAAAKALDDCDISSIKRGRYIRLTADYPDESTLRRLFENEGFEITDSSYSDRVSLTVLGPEEKAEDLVKRVVDMTGGKAACELLESVYY